MYGEQTSMSKEEKKKEIPQRTIHTQYARELFLKICVLCLFGAFYGSIWPLLATQLQLHPVINWAIKLSTQLGIAFYMLYQIPRTLRLLYEDWKENQI